MSSRGRHVTIVGAGIVGACCALALRREGFDVALLDSGVPGSGCSSGNAGLISASGCVPIGMPGTIWRVPRLLVDPGAALSIDWRYLPKLAPWLYRFLRACSPRRVEQTSIALTQLLVRSAAAYRELLGETDYLDLIRGGGFLYTYERLEAFEAARAGHDLRRRRGIRLHVLEPDQIRQMDPALAPIYQRAVHFPDSHYTVNPQRLVQRIAARFEHEGGEIVRTRVGRLVFDSRGHAAADTDTGRRKLDLVVVCAGAHSKDLARQCGTAIPLDTERGYHAMLPNPGIAAKVPILSGDHDFAVTPMEQGLRLAGTIELAGLSAPPRYSRAENLLKAASRMYRGLETAGATFWMGFRPSMPDSLPVISRVPGNAQAFIACGHGHLGMTFGAITGLIIRDLVLGLQGPLDVGPFRADRF